MLRKIFCPTPEEKIERYKTLLNRCCIDDGSCDVCVHHIPVDPHLPGFGERLVSHDCIKDTIIEFKQNYTQRY